MPSLLGRILSCLKWKMILNHLVQEQHVNARVLVQKTKDLKVLNGNFQYFCRYLERKMVFLNQIQTQMLTGKYFLQLIFFVLQERNFSNIYRFYLFIMSMIKKIRFLKINTFVVLQVYITKRIELIYFILHIDNKEKYLKKNC